MYNVNRRVEVIENARSKEGGWWDVIAHICSQWVKIHPHSADDWTLQQNVRNKEEPPIPGASSMSSPLLRIL